MKIIKLLLISCIIIFTTNSIYSTSMQININEINYIYEIENQQFEITSSGIININNPTNHSSIYETNIEFRDDIFLNLNINNPNLILTQKNIKGRDIFPNSSISYNYIFNGILTKTLYENFSQSNKSLFEWYSKSIKFIPTRYMTLNKFERENSNTTNISSRPIIIEGKNIGEFDIEILKLDLFKTTTFNSSQNYNQQLLNTYQNINLKPQDTFIFNYIDYSSNDKTTYWIDSKITTLNNITTTLTNNYFPKQITSNSGSNNQIEKNQNTIKNKEKKLLIFTKDINKEIISLKDKINVSLNIQNPNNYEITNLTIQDIINEYFQITNLNYNNVKIKDNKLNFLIPKILSYENIQIQYELKFNQKTNDSLIYFNSAKLNYDKNIIYSNHIILLNDISKLEKKLILEKEIKYLDETKVRVIIRLKNIGQEDFNDLTIIEENNEITILENNKTNTLYNKKWDIAELKVGKNWETYYDIQIEQLNKNIPQIYGAEEGKIYKTIILNEKIATKVEYPKIKTYQKIMISAAVLLLFIDVLF